MSTQKFRLGNKVIILRVRQRPNSEKRFKDEHLYLGKFAVITKIHKYTPDAWDYDIRIRDSETLLGAMDSDIIKYTNLNKNIDTKKISDLLNI